MKILYFTKYSRNAGSSRLRSYQYFPWLEKAGYSVEVSPLFSENYLKQLYSGQTTYKEAAKGYLKRLLKLFSVTRYDRIVIEKELFPYWPAFAEWLLSITGVRYTVDYDDAIFHNYDQSANPLIKKMLGKKIDAVMKYSSCVVAGNRYLAERAANAGAKHIEIIPTVIDLERYPLLPSEENNPIILGWIGTRSTFEKHVLPVLPWIQKALEQNSIEFHVVGIQPATDYGRGVHFFPWDEHTEVAMIRTFSIGIMPLQDTLWEQGKCAYKLIQYMACAKAVIASPVGMNREVVQDGVNGYTAENEKEWLDAIKTLVDSETKRKKLGIAGRKLVEEKYAVQVTAGKWTEILR